MKSLYAVDVEKFINDNWNAEITWPCVCRSPAGSASRTQLLIWGDLVVDLPIRVAAPITPRLVSRWRHGEPPGCHWDIGRPSLGGLVGKAAPVAAQLDCDVHIAAVIPLPTPALIRRFLESRLFDSRHVVACPGPVPVTLELQFTDRCIAISHPGVSTIATAPVPSNLGETFDALLVDAGRPEGRRERLEALIEGCRWGHREVPLGVIGRGDLTAVELQILSRRRCWLFLTEAEAREAAGHIVGNRVHSGLAEPVAELKHRLGPGVRLVVSSRDRGICLMNGAAEPRLFPTPRVAVGRAGGARYVFNVQTLLASMRGLSDDAAIRVGLDAAADHLSGNRLPEIDVGHQSPAVV